ncbi:monodechloroaminopyrrolnitrin synthase PrnB family protein, partial [Shewanella sp. 0m-11]
MTQNTQAFDHWIRTRFVELNSELESLYAEQSDRANVEGVGEHLKLQLESEGRQLIASLLA